MRLPRITRRRDGEIREQADRPAAIGEITAVAAVEVAFRRKAFGEDDIVRGKLQVTVFDSRTRFEALQNAVHQQQGRDQDACQNTMRGWAIPATDAPPDFRQMHARRWGRDARDRGPDGGGN